MGYKAFQGLDVVRGPNWQPVQKTRKGWQQYANREANKLTKQTGVVFNGVVAWIESRGCYRISFGAMPMDTR